MSKELLNSENIKKVESEIRLYGNRCYYVIYYLMAYCGYELAALLDIKITDIEVTADEISYIPSGETRLYSFVFPKEITNELKEIIASRSCASDYLFQSLKGTRIQSPNYAAFLTDLGKRLGIENLSCRSLNGWFGNDAKLVHKKRKNISDISVRNENTDFVRLEIYQKVVETNAEIPRVILEISSIEDEKERALRLSRIMSAYAKLLDELKAK